MRVEGDWLHHPGTQAVMEMLKGAGHQTLFVGGCVRNAALGTTVSDIDIATDARPETVIALSEAAGLKPVPTGMEHGTITVIAKGLTHEVTTFRRDVETDGRRAVVAFADTIGEDAARRDFTMNALYADATGQVIDPTGQGIADLNARRLRFIGAPQDRIREDYLRILRYFRFHAWYGDQDAGFDPDALAAIAELTEGLEGISNERIGQEIRKLLSAPQAATALATMAQTGVLRVVLPGAEPRTEVVLESLQPEPRWLPRLAALGGEDVEDRLRLSNQETRDLGHLRTHMGSTETPGALGYRLGPDLGQDVVLLRAATFETPPDPTDLDTVKTGANAKFPIKAADLPDLQGPDLGAKLKALEAAWIASGFTLTKSELLA